MSKATWRYSVQDNTGAILFQSNSEREARSVARDHRQIGSLASSVHTA